MMLEDLAQKKILIFGFGREGKDTLAFLKKHVPENRIGVADKRESPTPEEKKLLGGIPYFRGESYRKAFSAYELIIKSPGIPLHVLSPLLSKNQQVTSQTNIFLFNYPGTVIGVTGTKGKSTTASLIAHVLKKGGVRVKLAGNIGEPVLSYLENAKAEDVFVYELSSFQLETAEKSPHIAVFLNLYPEHIDHHGSFQKYAKAKANITRFQTQQDYFIFNAQDEFARGLAEETKAKTIGFTPKLRKDLPFLASPEPAILVGKLFGIPKEKTEETIKTFRPLEHRLQRVGKWRGIEFYNDSLATIPQATASALDALKGRVSVLVAGGMDRGISYKPLAEAIVRHKIPFLVLFPNSGEKVLEEVQKLTKKIPSVVFVASMEEAIQACYTHAKKGSVCLLSPAAPSFNLFVDYQDRGEQFGRFAAKYGKAS